MPISGPSSYVPTADEFIQHWTLADSTLGVGNEIVLPDGTDQAGLTTQKDALVSKRADVQAKLNDKEVARGDLEVKKAALLGRLVQFNDKIRAFFAGSKWVNALPAAPGGAEAQSRITDPLDDVSSLWQQINADPDTPAPVTLLGGYDQATLVTDLAALKTAYSTLNSAETTLKVTREERNDLQDGLYAVLKSYRAVLPTFFAKGDALVESLPRLTPAPGSTPDAVVLSGQWDDVNTFAQLNWTASSDPNLTSYDIRMSPGPTYSTSDETVVDSVIPGTLGYTTLEGLELPGSTAGYKVYVVTSTGNEKGSNAVIISRP